MFFVKTPSWLKKFYSNYVWSINTAKPIVYLTFDDGPNAVATPFVLDLLKQYDAKATFFCIGKNVMAEPELYKRILYEGHAVGNHTQNHLNGWKTDDRTYLANVIEARNYIDSRLFRPPYGRITRFQAKQLMALTPNLKIIMWDVLSGDFDNKISQEDCYLNTVKNTVAGSIIVFHDSEKAFKNVSYTLPRALEYFSKKGFIFNTLHEILSEKGPE